LKKNYGEGDSAFRKIIINRIVMIWQTKGWGKMLVKSKQAQRVFDI
jgi:hypothetical protein